MFSVMTIDVLIIGNLKIWTLVNIRKDKNCLSYHKVSKKIMTSGKGALRSKVKL